MLLRIFDTPQPQRGRPCSAAVNVNVWITEDDASIDKDHGGARPLGHPSKRFLGVDLYSLFRPRTAPQPTRWYQTNVTQGY